MQSDSSWHSKLGFQSWIGFTISACFHLSLCLTLALISISVGGTDGSSLKLGIASSDNAEDFAELSLTNESPPVDPEEHPDPTPELTISTDSSLTASIAGATMGGGSTTGDRTSLLALTAGVRGGDGTEAILPKSRASFFGAIAEGNRFVFIIDSSGSMRGPRWESLCTELIRAIKSLSPDQEFFVISFDSFAHPMFGVPPPKGKFLNAVNKNVDRLQNWIRSIRLGNNTLPAAAVGIAMKLKPDAIFLLSDGEILDSTLEDLRIWNRKKTEDGELKAAIPIHTVLLHSKNGYAALESIANENSGTFTPVQPR